MDGSKGGGGLAAGLSVRAGDALPGVSYPSGRRPNYVRTTPKVVYKVSNSAAGALAMEKGDSEFESLFCQSTLDEVVEYYNRNRFRYSMEDRNALTISARP